jgi:hypothetical protein
MRKLISFREAIESPNILGWALPGDSWLSWRALGLAALGEELRPDERSIYQKLTGREREPLEQVSDLVSIGGRRSGKTRGAGIIGAYIAGCCDHRDRLSAGETGTLLIMAPTQQQANVAFNYMRAAFTESPELAPLLVGETSDTLRLANGIEVVIKSANFRTIRGITCIGVIADEVAFWRSEESLSNPDFEILQACRPTLATTGGLLIIASSPHAKRGELYNYYRKHYGPEGSSKILVAKGASREFNISLPQSVVDAAVERDPAAASSEYLGNFRDDISAYVPLELVDAAIETGVKVRPPTKDHIYSAFCDPSGGSSDSMTLAIAHSEKGGERYVLDCVVEKPAPFSPEAVVAEFSNVLREYRIQRVMGDRYSAEWVVEAFLKHNIIYETSSKSKSDLYLEFLPLLTSGKADLLDIPRLVSQLSSLERITARGGRSSVDHPRGGKDDVANSAAGVLVNISDLPVKGGNMLAWARMEMAKDRAKGLLDDRPKPIQWQYARGSVEWSQEQERLKAEKLAVNQ